MKRIDYILIFLLIIISIILVSIFVLFTDFPDYINIIISVFLGYTISREMDDILNFIKKKLGVNNNEND